MLQVEQVRSIGLPMLFLNLKVENTSQHFLYKAWNVLNRMYRSKKEEYYTFCTSWVRRAILITTGAKLLDTTYQFYGFSDDLIETIN